MGYQNAGQKRFAYLYLYNKSSVINDFLYYDFSEVLFYSIIFFWFVVFCFVLTIFNLMVFIDFLCYHSLKALYYYYVFY